MYSSPQISPQDCKPFEYSPLFAPLFFHNVNKHMELGSTRLDIYVLVASQARWEEKEDFLNYLPLICTSAAQFRRAGIKHQCSYILGPLTCLNI